jgi:Fe2+ transport system protein FeoA
LDQDPRFLQFASGMGLKPGVVVRVKKREALADAVSVSVKKGPSVTLGTGAAQKILVEAI